MDTNELPIRWRTSSKSGHGSNNCVEVGIRLSGPADEVLVRDSKDREGPVLRFDRNAWQNFLAFAADGSIRR